MAAIDITLKKLSDYLRTIHISDHSAEFIVDSNGYMIASSTADQRYDLIKQSYINVIKNPTLTLCASSSTGTLNRNGETVDVAFAALGNKSGLH